MRKATSNFLSVVHQYTFNVLLGLVALHFAAIVFYHVKHHDNLLKPMLTGDKQAGPSVIETRQSSLMLAIVMASISAGVVYWVVNKL